MINSKCIGFINFDMEKLQKDISSIEIFKFNNLYSEYFFGNWSSCPLWNRDGNSEDSRTYLYSGEARETSYLQQLPYIKSFILSTFDARLLKSARVFLMTEECYSIPHRDFLELQKSYHRIHIPLQTNEGSYHSALNTVFKMKKGEIWILQANEVHSTGYFSTGKRLHLVLDFEYVADIYAIFIEKSFKRDIKLREVDRSDVSDSLLNRIYAYNQYIDNHTFLDIVGALSKIHFFYKVSPILVFEWLYEIIHQSGKNHLLQKAEILEKSCLLQRETGNLPREFFKRSSHFNISENSKM